MQTLCCRNRRRQQRLVCTKKRKQQKPKRKKQKHIQRHLQKTKRTRRRETTIQKQTNKGGNIMPHSVFNKIKSIGYEFESPNLIPFRRFTSPDYSAFHQIEPEIETMYDVYVEKQLNKDTNFKVITDDDYKTYFNKQISNVNDYIYLNYKNDPKRYPLMGNNDVATLGHTEFLTTFYKPIISSEIIQTTLQQTIQYIYSYIKTLIPTSPAEITLKDTFTKKTTFFSDGQENPNFYLPMVGEVETMGTTIKQLIPYITFTVHMTFGCKFTDCIPIYQALLANSKSYIIREHEMMFNNIVNAVRDIVWTDFNSHVIFDNEEDEKYYHEYILNYNKNVETYLILLIYRYEVYKKYEEEKKTNPNTLYKYQLFFNIRHNFKQLYELIIKNSDDIHLTNIRVEYILLAKKYPQYKSEHILSYLDQMIEKYPLYKSVDSWSWSKWEHQPDYLIKNEIDYHSKPFPIQDNDIILVEFRGFQEEMNELLTTYATSKQRAEIQRNIDKCSQNAVGCYSLKNLVEFASLDLSQLQRRHAAKEIERASILHAPKVARTRKAPSHLQDFK